MTRFLRAGALAGLFGGLAMAVFLRVIGEGPIGRAVELEAAHTGGGATHDELFSRATQQIGGMIGAALFGVCIGVIAAVVLASVRHHLTDVPTDWKRSVRLAAIGFVTLSLVPFLKYPANPPAVGDPDTVGRRTALFLVVVLWSVIASAAAFRFAIWLRHRAVDHARRLPAALALHAVLAGAALVLLPGNPDPVTAPADLVWDFRVAALGGAAVLWAVIGTSLGWLLQRDEARALAAVPAS